MAATQWPRGSTPRPTHGPYFDEGGIPLSVVYADTRMSDVRARALHREWERLHTQR